MRHCLNQPLLAIKSGWETDAMIFTTCDLQHPCTVEGLREKVEFGCNAQQQLQR